MSENLPTHKIPIERIILDNWIKLAEAGIIKLSEGASAFYKGYIAGHQLRQMFPKILQYSPETKKKRYLLTMDQIQFIIDSNKNGADLDLILDLNPDYSPAWLQTTKK